jgi:hypothetical protein
MFAKGGPHTAFDDLKTESTPWIVRLEGLLQLQLVGRVAGPVVACLADCCIKLVLERFSANDIDWGRPKRNMECRLDEGVGKCTVEVSASVVKRDSSEADSLLIEANHPLSMNSHRTPYRQNRLPQKILARTVTIQVATKTRINGNNIN